MDAPYRKKLIEVPLPLKAVDEALAQEKPTTLKGPPSDDDSSLGPVPVVGIFRAAGWA